MAPATIGAGIPILRPIPIPATPIVPIVDQELPIANATIEQMTVMETKNSDGVKVLNRNKSSLRRFHRQSKHQLLSQQE